MVDVVEIKQEPEHAITQPMHTRPQAVVDDVTGVDTGGFCHAAAFRELAGAGRWMRPDSCSTRHGRRTSPTASATANPACRPSSWKPAPKYAPQNQVRPRPCSDHNWRCAFMAAASKIGCSYRSSRMAAFGSRTGLSVTNNCC